MTKRRETMHVPPNEFALRLRALREEKNLSIRDLALLAHISAATIWKWEHGYNEPQSRLLPALVQALGVPVSSLIAPAGAEGALTLVPAFEPLEAEDSAAPAPSQALANVVAQAKQMIAKAAGHPPDKIVIRLDF